MKNSLNLNQPRGVIVRGDDSPSRVIGGEAGVGEQVRVTNPLASLPFRPYVYGASRKSLRPVTGTTENQEN